MAEIIEKNSQPIGILDIPEDHREPIARALAGTPYTLSHAVEHGEATYDIVEKCSPEKPRACEIGITLAVLEELAVKAQTDPEAIRRLAGQGHMTEAEARAAADATRRQLSGDDRALADAWYVVCFGEETDADGRD